MIGDRYQRSPHLGIYRVHAHLHRTQNLEFFVAARYRSMALQATIGVIGGLLTLTLGQYGRIVRKFECAAGATSLIDYCCHKSSNACGPVESRSNNCRAGKRVGL
jgi:hypothetical protein